MTRLEAVIFDLEFLFSHPNLIKEYRDMNLKIGATTHSDMMIGSSLLMQNKNYAPDTSVCSNGKWVKRGTHGFQFGQFPLGSLEINRPEPYMCILNAMMLNPNSKSYQYVKIDSTLAGVEEGRNAGMWTIGFTKEEEEISLMRSKGADYVECSNIKVIDTLRKINLLLDPSITGGKTKPNGYKKENDFY